MDWADRPLAAAVLASLTTGGLVGETATRLFRAGLVTPEALDLTGKAARSLASPPQMVLDTPLIPSLMAHSLGGMDPARLWGLLCGFAAALLVLGFLVVLADAPLGPGTKTAASLLAFVHPAVILLVTTSPSGTLGLLFLAPDATRSGIRLPRFSIIVLAIVLIALIGFYLGMSWGSDLPSLTEFQSVRSRTVVSNLLVRRA